MCNYPENISKNIPSLKTQKESPQRITATGELNVDLVLLPLVPNLDIDLEVVAAATDDYILTFDSATGGFEWVNPAAVGVTLVTGVLAEALESAKRLTKVQMQSLNVDGEASAARKNISAVLYVCISDG